MDLRFTLSSCRLTQKVPPPSPERVLLIYSGLYAGTFMLAVYERIGGKLVSEIPAVK